jgi:hypothetical protein
MHNYIVTRQARALTKTRPLPQLRSARSATCGSRPARCCCRPPSPGNFSLVGEGLNVGKDPGEPVIDLEKKPSP